MAKRKTLRPGKVAALIAGLPEALRSRLEEPKNQAMLEKLGRQSWPAVMEALRLCSGFTPVYPRSAVKKEGKAAKRDVEAVRNAWPALRRLLDRFPAHGAALVDAVDKIESFLRFAEGVVIRGPVGRPRGGPHPEFRNRIERLAKEHGFKNHIEFGQFFYDLTFRKKDGDPINDYARRRTRDRLKLKLTGEPWSRPPAKSSGISS